jgi:hypothetical protein
MSLLERLKSADRSGVLSETLCRLTSGEAAAVLKVLVCADQVVNASSSRESEQLVMGVLMDAVDQITED